MPLSFAILTIVLSYTWILQPRLASSWVAVPVAAVLGLGLWNALRSREWGLDVDALLPALRATFFLTVPIVAILIVAGAMLGTLHGRPDALGNFLALIPWGGGQQWILQTVMLREAQRATSRRTGVLVASLLFAALHLPNPFVTAVTLIGALGWCAIYDRYPNIIPLGLSHAIATLAILYAFDDAVTGRLRIGAAYVW